MPDSALCFIKGASVLVAAVTDVAMRVTGVRSSCIIVPACLEQRVVCCAGLPHAAGQPGGDSVQRSHCGDHVSHQARQLRLEEHPRDRHGGRLRHRQALQPYLVH